MKVFEYEARAGVGVIFPAKSFIIEGELDIYIISPGPLSSEVKDDLKKADKDLHFIAPNNFHNMYLSQMKLSFPKAKFYGPKRAMKVSGVDLTPISELPNHELRAIPIKGNKTLAETCFYDVRSKELFITDLVFNMNHKMNFATKVAIKMAGAYHKVATSRIIKFSTKDKEAFKKSLSELLELKLDKVYVNHGDPLTKSELEKHFKESFL